MRKHDVRKWLHAILDLLPVILIPVFMIYSHRHDVTERTDVEVTYKYESNEVNTLDDLVEGNIYQFNCETLALDEMGFTQFKFTLLTPLNIDKTYLTYYDNDRDFDVFNPYLILTFNENGVIYCSFDSDNSYGVAYEYTSFFLNNCIIQFDYCDDIDLSLLTYTDYNVIESVEINDTKSSVMNVFMDDFNNSIDKYFNMGNVFNLNGVYEWFNTNIFSGHAPTVIYSIWNIALYELVMDLLFLLYGLFMWFIDMIQKLMEKPLNSVR